MSDLLIENIKVYGNFLKKNNLCKSGQLNLIQLGGKDGDNLDPFYSKDIEDLTKQNNDYRSVLYTGHNQQFVLMSIPPQENIPMEIHKSHDQFVRIEQGQGIAVIGENTFELQDNTAFIVPAGSSHEITNTSKTESLKLYTIYSPPEHPDKLIQPTNPNKSNVQMDLNNVELYSESAKQNLSEQNSDEFISKEIIEKQLKELKQEENILKGGVDKLNNEKNIDYNKKYTDYKNKYITLKNFISKYYE
jgi:mannose-6-phosphate isomerase-like protein (cupin superfamily)